MNCSLALFLCLRTNCLRLERTMAGAITNEFSEEGNPKSTLCQSAIDLSECLKSSVQTLLDNVSDEKFVSFYKACLIKFEIKHDITRPALSGSSVEGRMYHSQFNDIFKRSVFETIEETISSMNDNFKELEKLKIDQTDNTVIWRPPGNAADHLVPFEYVCEMEKKKELEGKIESEQEAINIIKSRLVQKRKKVLELNEKLNSSIEEIKKVVCSEINYKEV